MSLSLIFLLGLLMIFLITAFKNNPPLDNYLTKNAIRLLYKKAWFQGYWRSGLFLFAVNAVLFSTTVLLLYILIFIQIPYLHIAVMGFAVYASILAWFSIGKSWDGTRRNRLKMGLIGSSFYALASALIIYKECHLKPAYPGDDTWEEKGMSDFVPQRFLLYEADTVLKNSDRKTGRYYGKKLRL